MDRYRWVKITFPDGNMLYQVKEVYKNRPELNTVHTVLAPSAAIAAKMVKEEFIQETKNFEGWIERPRFYKMSLPLLVLRRDGHEEA